jgi:hypothetical protein
MDEPKFKKADVDVRKVETLYDGFFKMKIYSAPSAVCWWFGA